MAQSKRTVLLVDDDPDISQLVRLALHGPGCHVLVAEHPGAAPESADLALVEQGMGPLEATVSNLVDHGCPVLVLASEPALASHVRAIHLGAWDYLQKPLDGPRLGRLVQMNLSRVDAGERPAPVEGPAVDQLGRLLRQIENDASTGVLTLQRPGEQGHLLFSFGEVGGAELGTLRGRAAINMLATHGDWTLSFTEDGEITDSVGVPTVRRPVVSRPQTETRRVFYGPPPTPPAEGIDPHAAVTRRNELPAIEAASTVVDGPPVLDAVPTQLSSPEEVEDAVSTDFADNATGEFIDEDLTTDPAPDRRADIYADMQFVLADEETAPKKRGG